LQNYFAFRGVPFREEWVPLSEIKLVAVLAEYLTVISAEADQILLDLGRLDPLASERGVKVTLSALEGDAEAIETLGGLANNHERALWLLMHRGSLLKEAEELLFYDYHVEGQRGRHFSSRPGLSISRQKTDLDAFAAEICAFYRKRDGAGISCHVEFLERRSERSVQLTLYVQGLPSHTAEFVDGEFRRRVSHPAIEAAIVYEPATGMTSTVVKGGKDAHEALREAFARKLLKVDPQFDEVERRSFSLDTLRFRRPLVADEQSGLKGVRVRKLKLAPPSYDSGTLTIEAPSNRPDISVYDLADEWFAEQSPLLSRFSVIHATLAFHFHPRPGARRPRTINVGLTKPNTSSLRDLAEADREVVEHHIRKWKLFEEAGVERVRDRQPAHELM
jgi:hypothetical protein